VQLLYHLEPCIVVYFLSFLSDGGSWFKFGRIQGGLYLLLWYFLSCIKCINPNRWNGQMDSYKYKRLVWKISMRLVCVRVRRYYCVYACQFVVMHVDGFTVQVRYWSVISLGKHLTRASVERKSCGWRTVSWLKPFATEDAAVHGLRRTCFV